MHNLPNSVLTRISVSGLGFNGRLAVCRGKEGIALMPLICMLSAIEILTALTGISYAPPVVSIVVHQLSTVFAHWRAPFIFIYSLYGKAAGGSGSGSTSTSERTSRRFPRRASSRSERFSAGRRGRRSAKSLRAMHNLPKRGVMRGRSRRVQSGLRSGERPCDGRHGQAGWATAA